VRVKSFIVDVLLNVCGCSVREEESSCFLVHILGTFPEFICMFYSGVGEGPELFCVTLALSMGEW